MKKSFWIICVAWCWALTMGLASCSSAQGDGTHRIMTSIEPLRYLVDQVAGNEWTTSALVPDGFSPEEYSPSTQQMAELSNCTALFTIGQLPIETTWIPRIESSNPTLRVVDTSTGLKEHGMTFDPHTWTSPTNARHIVGNIADALCEIDPDHANLYKDNMRRAQAAIDSLHSTLTETLADLPSRSFVIAHPALTQFAADYGLHQIAIEVDGKEPTPASLQALISQARAEGVKVVFVQREFADRSARIIAQQLNANLVQINPLAYDWTAEMTTIARTLKNGK
ncbi:MAG: zinc ABC transporter substrate-binding protein [Bacteroidaceae bacterium]|nr:zinc ABC transporter substrate-binding protein [Bacteroidaceae bacterium]